MDKEVFSGFHGHGGDLSPLIGRQEDPQVALQEKYDAASHETLAREEPAAGVRRRLQVFFDPVAFVDREGVPKRNELLGSHTVVSFQPVNKS